MNGAEHRTVREMLGAYALGALDETERDQVAAHLDRCAPCRAELEAIAPLVEPLSEVAAETLAATPMPPDGLGEHIVAEIRDERSRDRRRLPRWAVATVAAVITAAIALPAGYTVAPAPPDEPIEPVAVTVLEPDVDAEAEVIPHTWGMEIVLTGHGFDEGETYTAEVIDEHGQRASAGEFIGTGRTEMVCNLNSSVLQRDVAGFEVHDGSGDVVLSSSM